MVRAPGVVALAVAVLMTAAPVIAAPAVVTCPRLSTAPVVDGTLSPGEWSHAAALGPFALLKGGGMPSLTTEAWIGYTDDGVYLGARLFDPTPMQIHCYTTTRDGAVGADDSLHLLLDTDGTGRNIIHLAVNAAGARYDALNSDVSVDFNWTAATGLTGDGWIVEMVARFESNAARDGDTWRMTCFRNAPRLGEKSAWSALQRDVLEPDNFGQLIFGGPKVRCEVEPVDTPWFGDNEAAVTIRNFSDADLTCKINARVTGATRRAHSFSVTRLTIPAGASSEATAAFKVQRGGPGAVQISVQVIEGDKAVTALRTLPMPFELPALGQALDDALSAIAQAYKLYATTPEQSRPEDAATELGSLLARWRYLQSQYADRATMSVSQLDALVGRAKALKDDAGKFTAKLQSG